MKNYDTKITVAHNFYGLLYDTFMLLLCVFYSLNDNPTSPFAFHESKQTIIVQKNMREGNNNTQITFA